MTNPFRTALVFALLGGSVMACARPAFPIMSGEKTGKTRRYEAWTDFRDRQNGAASDLARIPARTREEIETRFEKAQEIHADLLGWRQPFEDYCRSSCEWLDETALTDLLAKEKLLRLLATPDLKTVAPDIAKRQFEMRLALIQDMFSEAEGVSPEKSYRPIFELRGEGLGYANLPLAMAKFLYARQKHLEKIREEVLLRERDELLYWSSGDPEKMREYFASLKKASRWKQKDVPVSENAWCGRLDHDELYPLLCFIGMEPMSDELRARVPVLQKSLHDYWMTWWKPDTGGRGSGM